MKKNIFTISLLLVFFSFSLNKSFAQNDTIYMMKNGSIIWKSATADIDSIVFYKPVVEDTSGTFTDFRDTTEYSWIKIGEQVWMAENLKYLPSVIGSGTESFTEPYYYVYGYNGTSVAAAKATENYTTYGVLYNWTAAMSACPEGWHMPSDAEWKQLEMYIGMTEEQANGWGWRGSNEADKLKETGTTHWPSPNEGATNEVGFTALPSGEYDYGFYNIGNHGYWWTATEYETNSAWNRYIYYNFSSIGRFFYYRSLGYSVRCVRD